MSLRQYLNTEGSNIGKITGNMLAIDVDGTLSKSITANGSILLTGGGASPGVLSVNGLSGVVLLDCDDIPVTLTREYITPAEKAQITSNTNDIIALQSDVTNNTNDISTLQTDVINNTNDISTLQTDVINNTNDISTLQTDVTNNTNDISTLQTDVNTNNGASQLARVAVNGWLPYNIVRSNKKVIDGTFTNNPTPNEQPSSPFNLTDHDGNPLYFKDCIFTMYAYDGASMPLPNTGARWHLVYPSEDGSSVISIYSNPVSVDLATQMIFYRRLDRYDNIPYRIIYTW